jgi:hypothetical protein
MASSSNKTLHVTVTGAAGQIGYALVSARRRSLQRPYRTFRFALGSVGSGPQAISRPSEVDLPRRGIEGNELHGEGRKDGCAGQWSRGRSRSLTIASTEGGVRFAAFRLAI